MKTALVTGGLGFIGSHLVKKLIEEGFYVDVVDNCYSGTIQNLISKKIDFTFDKDVYYSSTKRIKFKDRKQSVVHVLKADYADDCILNLVKQKEYQYIFHQAAIPRVSYSVEKPYETTENNLSKLVKLLEASIGNIEKFIFASSSSVYGGAENMPTHESTTHDVKSPYALQKSAGEKFISLFSELYDFDGISLRYFNVFGPGQMGDSPYSTAIAAWCNAIKDGRELRSDGDGSQSRDLCYIDNVVQANLKAALSDIKFKGKAYNIACGDRTTNKEILDELVKRYPGIKIRHAPWRPGDVMHTQADISEAQKDFGYNPDVKFWDGFEKTLAWWKL